MTMAGLVDGDCEQRIRFILYFYGKGGFTWAFSF